MATNESINDELTSINSIYEEGTLSPLSSSDDVLLFSLRLPSLPSVTLRLEFPADYPDAPPSILGTQSVGEDLPKGAGNQVVALIRDVLAQVYRPGEACIFDLLEESREAIEKAEEQGILHTQDTHQEEQSRTQESSTESAFLPDPLENLGPEPPWIVAPPITEKKSIFLARVAKVSSPAEAKSFVRHLLATDKKAARATHNITAWRIRGPNDTSYQDCDDDGETAAGGRILHLMQLMDVWDVMVVVTRWYGGILLGPDRFRIINTAAREGLLLGGYGVKENLETKRKGKR